jgi:hypothetical protein
MNWMPFRDTTRLETETFKEVFRQIFECNFPAMPVSLLTNTFLMRSRVADEYVNCINHFKDETPEKFEHNCLTKGCLGQYCAGAVNAKGEQTQQSSTVVEAIQNDCAEYLSLARGDQTLEKLLRVKPAFNFSQEKMDCFVEYGQCIDGLKKHASACLEQTKIQEVCQERKIRAAKVLRIKMKEYENLAEEFPDLSVIFYTRDPRAIANSRQFGGNNVNQWITETKQLCKEMHQDFHQMEKIKHKYPGLILNLRYEDLVEDPVEMLRKVYAHFKEQPSDSVKKWIVYAMFASDDDSDFGVKRKDARSTRDKWKTVYPADVIERVSHDQACEPVLSLLGYL